MTMESDPRWSPEVRADIKMAMNSVIREAADIVQRRSHAGQWLPPGETDELGTNSALCTAARIWVLDKLEAQIQEARRVLDRVEAECREQTGVTSRPRQDSD
ncbi:hypothetical protein [Streptomyces longwoodensis]|uniref:hypothetical protein n=1 Tax=Streptomyces longwoodensis TaxID=68231 RepID=UPI00340B41E8